VQEGSLILPVATNVVACYKPYNLKQIAACSTGQIITSYGSQHGGHMAPEGHKKTTGTSQWSCRLHI